MGFHNKIVEQNGVDLDLQVVREQVLNLNTFNRTYAPCRIIGAEHMAEIVDRYVNLMVVSNGHLVPVALLAKAASISWKVAKGILNSGKG